MEVLQENTTIIEQTEIIVIKIFDDFPHIVQTEDNKIYQLSYIDSIGRLRKYKELKPTKHNGSLYYIIDRNRYSEYKLLAFSKKCRKRIDLTKKVIKYNI
jgi:hypothetical protein